MTNQLLPGQKVIYAGFPGSIVRHYSGNQYEIRLASGGVCSDDFEIVPDPLTVAITVAVGKDNRAVVINKMMSGRYTANLYVNVRDGIASADITLLRWTGKTLAGALKWANKQLAT